MSKGTRKREAAAIRRAEEERQLAVQQKKRRRNKLLIACTAVVAVVAIVIGTVAYVNHKRANDPDYLLHNTVAASSDNYEVTQAMMTYFMRSTYMNFAYQYEDYLDTMGLDTSISLKNQTCYFSDDITWFDYFAESARDSVNWMLGFAEKARAAGMSLTDEDKEAIDETLGQITPENFGEYITEDDIRACLEIYYLADKQEAKVQESLIATDANVNAYADAHNKELLEADIAFYTISYGDSLYYTDKATAEALADKLLAASPEEFAALVKGELVARKLCTEDTVDEKYPELYEEDGYTYLANDGFSEWLFGGSVSAGNTYEFEETGSITVVLARTTPVRDTSPTANVRHILLTADKYGSEDAAKKKADEVLAAWQAGEASENSFGELAKEYSEDGNASEGGLYTEVYPGQMVDTFNDWCFDAERKAGDTGIVKTSYGYHVMYYVSAGDEVWYITSREGYLDEVYEEIYQGYITEYNVKTDNDAINGLDL